MARTKSGRCGRRRAPTDEERQRGILARLGSRGARGLCDASNLRLNSSRSTGDGLIKMALSRAVMHTHFVSPDPEFVLAAVAAQERRKEMKRQERRARTLRKMTESLGGAGSVGGGASESESTVSSISSELTDDDLPEEEWSPGVGDGKEAGSEDPYGDYVNVAKMLRYARDKEILPTDLSGSDSGGSEESGEELGDVAEPELLFIVFSMCRDPQGGLFGLADACFLAHGRWRDVSRGLAPFGAFRAVDNKKQGHDGDQGHAQRHCMDSGDSNSGAIDTSVIWELDQSDDDEELEVCNHQLAAKLPPGISAVFDRAKMPGRACFRGFPLAIGDTIRWRGYEITRISESRVDRLEIRSPSGLLTKAARP